MKRRVAKSRLYARVVPQRLDIVHKVRALTFSNQRWIRKIALYLAKEFNVTL